MLKKSFLLLAASVVAMGASAETLTPQQALKRAQSGNSERRMAAASLSSPVLAYTAKTAANQPALYVFNEADNGGFVVLSADDAALPVLGYTDAGAFDPANIPPQFEYWMNEYASQIAYARENNIQSKDMSINFPSSWTPITPLLKTNWDQNEPYNRQTPMINNQHTPTGCVATAMAQVLNYWEYPKTNGKGQISYTWENAPSIRDRTLTMTFDKMPALDWSNMLDNYVEGKYTNAQGDAVANLMVQCGYAVQMQYGPVGSGTQTEVVGPALMNYFGFNKGITVEQRIPYTASEWNELCYNQLKIGPVIYGGTSLEAGHCFVMDGYDGNGYFHFNWGWSGMCNGYYLLNALNPTAQGSGGSYGGYNNNQVIVAGVQPDYLAPIGSTDYIMSFVGTLQAAYKTSTNTLSFGFTNPEAARIGNDGMYAFTPEFSIEFANENGGTNTYVSFPLNFGQLPPGAYWTNNQGRTFDVRIPTTIGDGTYKATLMYRRQGTSEWKRLKTVPGNYDYVIVKKIGSSVGVTNMQPQTLKITEAKLTSPLYYNNPCAMELTVSNPGDVEITQSLVPYLLNSYGDAMYMCENRLITVEPGETAKIELSGMFLQLSGASVPTTSQPVDLVLAMVDGNTNLLYGTYGTVTMKRSGINASMRIRNLTISNAEERFMVDGIGNVYGLNNFKDINVEFTLEGQNGFVASPLTAIVSEIDTETPGAGVQIFEDTFAEMVYLESGESMPVSTTLHFDNPDLSKIYQLAIFYNKGTTRTQLSVLRFAASSGVEEVIAGNEGLEITFAVDRIMAASQAGIAGIEVYDAGGNKVAATRGASLDISSLGRGLYIVRAVDNNGNAGVKKVVK